MNLEQLASQNTTIYGESYTEVARKPIKEVAAAQGWFSQAERATVESKEFEWGTGRSICFHCKGGGKHYEILSAKSGLQDGQEVDLQTVAYVHLHRTGEDKLRVDGVAKN